MALLLFQFPHAVGGTLFEGEGNPCRICGNSDELRDLCHLPRAFRLQRFVGHSSKRGLWPRYRTMSPYFLPTFRGMIEFARNKARDEFVQRKVVGNRAPLDVKVYSESTTSRGSRTI